MAILTNQTNTSRVIGTASDISSLDGSIDLYFRVYNRGPITTAATTNTPAVHGAPTVAGIDIVTVNSNKISGGAFSLPGAESAPTSDANFTALRASKAIYIGFRLKGRNSSAIGTTSSVTSDATTNEPVLFTRLGRVGTFGSNAASGFYLQAGQGKAILADALTAGDTAEKSISAAVERVVQLDQFSVSGDAVVFGRQGTEVSINGTDTDTTGATAADLDNVYIKRASTAGGATIIAGSGTAILTSSATNDQLIRLDHATYPFILASGEILTPQGSSVIFI